MELYWNKRKALGKYSIYILTKLHIYIYNEIRELKIYNFKLLN